MPNRRRDANLRRDKTEIIIPIAHYISKTQYQLGNDSTKILKKNCKAPEGDGISIE